MYFPETVRHVYIVAQIYTHYRATQYKVFHSFSLPASIDSHYKAAKPSEKPNYPVMYRQIQSSWSDMSKALVQLPAE